MSKKKIRHVMIESQTFGTLFSDIQTENLLVERLNGERLWVVSWKDIDEKI